MVNIGLTKPVADIETNQAKPKKKVCETKEKLNEGAKRMQPGTNKPQ